MKSGVNSGVKSGVKNGVNSGIIFFSSEPLWGALQAPPTSTWDRVIVKIEFRTFNCTKHACGDDLIRNSGGDNRQTRFVQHTKI